MIEIERVTKSFQKKERKKEKTMHLKYEKQLFNELNKQNSLA